MPENEPPEIPPAIPQNEAPPFEMPLPVPQPAFDRAALEGAMNAATSVIPPPAPPVPEAVPPPGSVAATAATPPESIPPVWVLTGTEMSAFDIRRINFDLFGLQRKTLVVKGELIREELYKSYETATPAFPKGRFTGLAIRIYNNYERKDGFVYRRLQTIEWLLSDGTVGTSIIDRPKVYSDEAQIAEGKRRRENIINFLTKQAVLMFGEAGGGQLLIGLKEQIEKYISGVTAPLIGAVGELPMAALDSPVAPGVTARQYFISELTLDY